MIASKVAALAAVVPGLRRPFGPARGDGVHWVGILFLALLAALIVAVVVWIVLQLGERRRPAPTSGGRADAALETLRIRYARGELDRDTYLRMTYDLGGPAAAQAAAGPPPGPQAPPPGAPPGA